MKRILALAGTMLLCACGAPDTRTQVPLGTLVVPNNAPWLILAPGPDVVELRGLDDKLRLVPDPNVAKALEAQMRAAVEADYFPGLTIACEGLQADLRVDQDDAPDAVTLSLSLDCTTNARGLIGKHHYAAAPTAQVKAGSADAVYAAAFPTLLRQAAAQMASALSADMRASRPANT